MDFHGEDNGIILLFLEAYLDFFFWKKYYFQLFTDVFFYFH